MDFTGGSIILIVLAVLVLALLFKGVKVIRQSEAMVVERFGKYAKTLNAGLHIIIPIMDIPRPTVWRYVKEGLDGQRYTYSKTLDRIDLRETVYDFPKQNVITRDNVVTEINALIYFQVVDAVKCVYEIANLPNAIEKLTQTTLRNVLGELDLDEVRRVDLQRVIP